MLMDRANAITHKMDLIASLKQVKAGIFDTHLCNTAIEYALSSYRVKLHMIQNWQLKHAEVLCLRVAKDEMGLLLIVVFP
jgi:hypothetical protein